MCIVKQILTKCDIFLSMKERLKEVRIEKGVSQEKAAKDLGLSKSAISNYETGLRQPTYDILIKLCKYYNVSADYLLGLTDY